MPSLLHVPGTEYGFIWITIKLELVGAVTRWMEMDGLATPTSTLRTGFVA